MGYISTAEVAEKLRKLKEAFPDYKFSIVKSGYSGISVTILEGTTQLLEDGENYKNVNEYYIDSTYKDRPEVRDVLSKIYSIINEGNESRETGDYGTQPTFYTYIYIGESDKKPYKYIPKKSGGRTFKKGFKKFGEKKTEGFEQIYNCGNGWKVFYKKNVGENKPNQYRIVKDYQVKPVDKEQFYALKGDMLYVGFLWNVKAQCFERFEISELGMEYWVSSCKRLSKYFPMLETETPPTEDTPPTETIPTTTTTKIPLKSVTLVWDDATFKNLEEVRKFMVDFYYENDESKLPQVGYDKYKIEFVWEDGSTIVDRIDVSTNEGDYNPFRESLSDYYNNITDGTKKFTPMYYYDYNTELKNLSFDDLEKPQPTTSTQEVDLNQLLSDMQLLVDLEIDETNKLSLLQYINDLQILKMLEN